MSGGARPSTTLQCGRELRAPTQTLRVSLGGRTPRFARKLRQMAELDDGTSPAKTSAMRFAPFILVGAVALAAALAILHPDNAPASSRTTPPLQEDPLAVAPPMMPPMGNTNELPPNHPTIGAGAGAGVGAGGPAGAIGPSTDEAPGMTWTMPSAWKIAPNPSSMRLATYKASGAPGAEDAEVSVSRAGGSLDANIGRWVTQFDGAGKEARTERTVHALKVTIVEIHGAYLGGGMGNAAPTSRPGWAMLAAIVPTAGTQYFVKMVGPDATVKASRASFDELVASIAPVP